RHRLSPRAGARGLGGRVARDANIYAASLPPGPSLTLGGCEENPRWPGLRARRPAARRPPWFFSQPLGVTACAEAPLMGRNEPWRVLRGPTGQGSEHTLGASDSHSVGPLAPMEMTEASISPAPSSADTVFPPT